MSTGWGAVRLVNKAPHTNAATVFINWLLSKEAQTAWATIGGRPSRRLDVPRVTGMSPEPGVDYFDIDREERLNLRDKGREIAKEVLK
jgi:ABC-type Fe3+ transport system substrate-binding protein